MNKIKIVFLNCVGGSFLGMDETTSSPPPSFTALYTSDINRKGTKRWHDGSLKPHKSTNNTFVYKLHGTPLCELESDPWDYEKGGERRGWKYTPVLETLKSSVVVVTGEEIKTSRHMITVGEKITASEEEIPTVKKEVQTEVKIEKPKMIKNLAIKNKQESQKIVDPPDRSSWYTMTYTEDAHKKYARKWFDGFFKWDGSSSATFYKEDKKEVICKHTLTMVEEGFEMKTGPYLIQLGAAENTKSIQPATKRFKIEKPPVPIKRESCEQSIGKAYEKPGEMSKQLEFKNENVPVKTESQLPERSFEEVSRILKLSSSNTNRDE